MQQRSLFICDCPWENLVLYVTYFSLQAMKFLEQAPGMMKDPDGMRAYGALQDKSHGLLPASTQLPQQQQQQQGNASTSVKDLIDQAIDEALTSKSSPEANNTTGMNNVCVCMCVCVYVHVFLCTCI